MSRKHNHKNNRQPKVKTIDRRNEQLLAKAIEHEETAAQFASAMAVANTRHDRYVLYCQGMTEALIMLECLSKIQ